MPTIVIPTKVGIQIVIPTKVGIQIVIPTKVGIQIVIPTKVGIQSDRRWIPTPIFIRAGSSWE
jgi:hypothetical protein